MGATVAWRLAKCGAGAVTTVVVLAAAVAMTGCTRPSAGAAGSDSVPALPEAHAPDEADELSTLRQHGLSVTFDEPVHAGQYVGGDHWVVGPVRLVATTPAWDGDRHGAMVNPVSGADQGYHRLVDGYDARLNTAAQLPVTLEPGASLVVTSGWLRGDPGAPATSWPLKDLPRPALRSAAVITVVDEPPAPDAFRPAWAEGPKQEHRLTDVRWDRLLRLAAPEPPDAAPAWSELEARTQRPWIDHKPSWTGYYLHPSENMPNYGADIGAQLNETILALQLDVPHEVKRPTLINTVQIGIDLHGATRSALRARRHDDGFAWHGESGGGIGSGRKWPVLFAGLMLDNRAMLAVGHDAPPRFFSEDCSTYTAEGTGREVRPAGKASWADGHCVHGVTGRPVDDAYRRCCTSAQWSGAALGARLLGLADEWDHDAFFDYVDWYMGVDAEPGSPERASSPFVERMWDDHR